MVVGVELSRRQTSFRYGSVMQPVNLIRWCRINSCSRGHSLGCTLKYIDQSTVCDVEKVYFMAGRCIGKFTSI